MAISINLINNGGSGLTIRNKLNEVITELNDAGSPDSLALLNADGNIDLTNLPSGLLTTSDKGIANGIAGLDANAKVPANQLPNSILEYKGTYDADTNTPALSDGDATNAGNVYRVSVAGSTDFGSGSISFEVGDYVIANDSGMWEKSDATNAVSSINGETGAVTLTTDDVSQGTSNLYYADSLVDSHLSGGTGINYSSGVISVDSTVLTSTPTLDEVATAGNSTTSLGLDIGGNLSVQGTDSYFAGNLAVGKTSTTSNFDVYSNANTEAFIQSSDPTNYSRLSLATDDIGNGKSYIIKYGSNYSTYPNSLALKNSLGDINFYAGSKTGTPHVSIKKSDGSLNVDGNKVATQIWVGNQGYITSSYSHFSNTSNPHNTGLSNLNDYVSNGNMINLKAISDGQNLLRFSHPSVPASAGMEIGFSSDNSKMNFDIEYSDVLSTAISITRQNNRVDVAGDVYSSGNKLTSNEVVDSSTEPTSGNYEGRIWVDSSTNSLKGVYYNGNWITI